MTNKVILIYALVIIEVIAIFILGSKIYTMQNNTAMIINPITKENLLFSSEGNLKNFYEHKPKRIMKDEGGKEIVNTINSDALNERFEYTTDKPKDTFRIISLGDSFTYGFGVNTPDNYSEVLEDLLNNELYCKNFKRFEVINLGVQGYDIEYAAERFRRRGQKYNPDLVIWLIKDDDFFPREVVLGPMLDSLERIQYQKKALRLFNTTYSKNPLLFLLFQITNKQRAALEDFTQSRDRTYMYSKISLSSEETIPGDGHPNKKGHRAFAEGLFEYITQNKIIPCD